MKTRKDLISAMASKSGITVSQATAAFDAMKEFIVENAKEGIQMIGFGSYSVTHKNEREGVGPSGQKMIFRAKNSLKFKASKEMEDRFQDR